MEKYCSILGMYLENLLRWEPHIESIINRHGYLETLIKAEASDPI